MTPTKPLTVAFVRSLIYAAVAGLLVGIIALTPADLAAFGPWAGVLGVLLPQMARYMEGAIFDRHQPPQAGLLGGQPAAPIYDWATEAAGEHPEPAA
ncbi:MAG TPA: hypothetical protein VF244_09260 [Acidimicrobiales bacterium]